MNIKNCKFGVSITLIVSMCFIILLFKSSLVTLILFSKYGLYQFTYKKILFDVIIVLIMLITIMFYYRSIIYKEEIKAFTVLGKAHKIKWLAITNIYLKKIFFINTLFIEENDKRVHIGLFGNFEQFKMCVKKFDQGHKLALYLNNLTSEEIKSIKKNNEFIGRVGAIAFLFLLSLSAYEHFIWTPSKFIEKVQTDVEKRSKNIPLWLGERVFLKNLAFYPDKKQTKYTYSIDIVCDEKNFDIEIKTKMENSIKSKFCTDKKAINYLNRGFSEIHSFHYKGCNEKMVTRQIVVDEKFCGIK